MLFFLEGNQEFAEALALNLLRAEKATDPADHGDGVMIAFQLEPDALPKLEVVWPKESSILPPVEHHVTLCFLGSASALEKSGLTADHLLINLRAFAENHLPVSGYVNGWGRVNGGHADAVYLNFDAAALPAFRQDLVENLALVAPPASSHGFTPHITLAYVPKGSTVDMVELPAKVKLEFDELYVAWGDEQYYLPLAGKVGAAKGGPGSGFHGHAGRPGERGGSAPAGRPAPADGAKVSIEGKLKIDTDASDPESWRSNPILVDIVEYSDAKIDPADYYGFIIETAEKQKHRAVTDLAKRSGSTYDDANIFIAQWAETSNGDDLRSLSIQEAAAEVMKVPLSDWQKANIDKVRSFREKTIASRIASAKQDKTAPLAERAATLLEDFASDETMLNMYEKDRVIQMAERLRSGNVKIGKVEDVRNLLLFAETASQSYTKNMVKAMYENTQERLRDLGVKELRLYRGVNLNIAGDDGEVITSRSNPLSSWTMDYEVARSFAEDGMYDATILEAIFPAERIYALPSTGVGCLEEYEAVVTGGTDSVRIRRPEEEE